MEFPHVVIISRSYWPQTSGQALHMRLVAESLSRLGVAVTVLTPKCHSSWPTPLKIGNARVVRISPFPENERSTSRYAQSIADWIKTQARVDLIIAEQDATELGETLRRLPKRQRPETWLIVQEVATPDDSLAVTLRHVDRAIVPSNSASKLVASLGVVSQRLSRVQFQLPEKTRGNDRDRLLARRLLEQVNTDLYARKYDRVMLCHCPMREYSRWGDIIRSLRDIIDSHRWLRWWIVGDGVAADAIYERLQYEGLHRLVAMPGVFTEVDLLFKAADLYLSVEEDTDSWLFQNAAINATPWINHEGKWADLSSTTSKLKQFGQDSLEQSVLAWLDCTESAQSLAFKNQRTARRPSEYPTLSNLVESFLIQHPSPNVSA